MTYTHQKTNEQTKNPTPLTLRCLLTSIKSFFNFNKTFNPNFLNIIHHIISVKILRSFAFFFSYLSLQNSKCIFILPEHLNLYQPHFKHSIVPCMYWPPYQSTTKGSRKAPGEIRMCQNFVLNAPLLLSVLH